MCDSYLHQDLCFTANCVSFQDLDPRRRLESDLPSPPSDGLLGRLASLLRCSSICDSAPLLLDLSPGRPANLSRDCRGSCCCRNSLGSATSESLRRFVTGLMSPPRDAPCRRAASLLGSYGSCESLPIDFSLGPLCGKRMVLSELCRGFCLDCKPPLPCGLSELLRESLLFTGAARC